MKGLDFSTKWILVANMFQYSAEVGYDARILAKVLLTTKYGIDVLSEKRISEYADDHYMLGGFEAQFDLGKDSGDFDEEMLYTMGFLYKYWYDKGGDPNEIYRLAFPDMIRSQISTLHVTGASYWVEHLKDLNGVIPNKLWVGKRSI